MVPGLGLEEVKGRRLSGKPSARSGPDFVIILMSTVYFGFFTFLLRTLSHGLADKDAAVSHFSSLASAGAGVVVAWGKQGSDLSLPDLGLASCAACPPLGAWWTLSAPGTK